MKQTLLKTLFLCLFILAGTTAFAYMVDGIYYNLNNTDQTASVTYGYNKYSGAVHIPEEIVYDGVTYSVTSIDDDAFYYCSDLTKLTIGNRVTFIGYEAFFGCSGLTELTIGNSVTSIGSWAFSHCSKLTELTIPNSVTSIGDGTFCGCSSLTELTIPNSVTSIGKRAFSGCSGLTKLTIGNSVTSIDDYAFDDCGSLTELTIGNSVTSIGDYAFYGCRGLTELTIPNSVTSIGYDAFWGCSGLTELTIGNSVTSIGDYAFYGCSKLTELTIPNSVTSIGGGAFSGCSALAELTIGNSVTSIGGGAFFGCSALTGLTIPNGVTSIGDNAFYGCSGLTELTIPNSVTSIGKSAFRNCSSLTELTIPNSVTSIGDGTFSDCSSLTELTIGSSVTSIGSWAFSDCSKLTELTIPNSVTSIGYEAFYGCSALTELTIGNSVTSIGSWAFSHCSKLTELTIPNSVTSIGDGAFESCSGLTELTIPNSVTSIGGGAFLGCSSLTELTIGNSVTSIGDWAFLGCSNLVTVYSLNTTPPVLSKLYNSFHEQYATIYVYVYQEALEAYKAAEIWKEFKNIIPLYTSLSLNVNVFDDQSNNVTSKVNIIWYDADGKQIGTGNRLSGIADSTEVYYSVLLDEELGRVYREVKMQKITTNKKNITCKLEKIGWVTLEGRVSATDVDKVTMTVDVMQMLNGKYEETFSTRTNEQGTFRIEVYDDETDITISGKGYLNATLHRDGFSGNGNIGTIPLSLINGFSITANVTLQKAVAAGEVSELSTWTDGLNNIEFTLTNTTHNMQITDFTVQNGNLIIKSGADVGDGISLTAKSKQGVFADATTTFTLVEGANAFNLQLTELGGLDAVCDLSNNSGTVGYLYDDNDVLVGKGSYIGETLAMRYLPNGVYTLVSMGKSLLLGSMTRLTDLAAIGLSEGKDYVTTRVEVVDGYLTTVSVNEVPRLDETQFYYTTDNTYFNANKSSVTAGNYLTLSAHVDFKAEHTGKVNGVTLTVDLPEGCQMVENSVIANREVVAHTVNGNRVILSLTEEQWQSEVRFCIIPTMNKSYTITAMALFDVAGQVQQPIGTVQVEAKGLSLSAPKTTANTNIAISGTAMGHSEISVYDNDVLIGTTTSKADGSWTAQCELYKPYSHSFHDIYAKIITESGLELTSETQQVEYDKYNIVPEKVTMLYYNGWYKKNVDVEFNLLEGIATPSSYPFYTATDFTFLADFTRNDTTQIKNVNIKVLNSDGTVRTLPATFDGKQNRWVASTKYSSASRLPRNVTVEYDLIPTEVPFDSTRIIDDNNQFINLIKNYVTNVDTTKFDVLDANESMIVCQYQTYTMDAPVFIRMEMLDYDKWITELENKDYFAVEYNGKITYMKDSIFDDRCVNWIWTIEDKNLLQIEISPNNVFNNISTLAVTIPGAALESLMTVFGINTIINNYNNGYEDLQWWLRKYTQTINDHFKRYNETKQLLDAKCPDGTLRLHNQVYEHYAMYLNFYLTDANMMSKSFKMRLEWLERDLIGRRTSAIASSVATSLASMVFGQGKLIANRFGTAVTNRFGGTIRNWLLGLLGDAIDVSTANVGNSVLGWLNNNTWYTANELNKWYYSQNLEIVNNYNELQVLIQKYYKKCDNEDEEQEEKNDEIIDEKSGDKSDFNGNGSTGIIDPSGYVYEAVTSNRLEGVTATCYQMVQSEDMYGDVTEEAVIWNAEDYSQQNPLKTDATGFYRWDVPQGMWQVKYEKEGYETVYSDWLPVPPPQLDVNIGMKQSTPPTVKQMRGFESGITIEMAKYMRPETMTEQNITVTRNGTAEKGSIELLNAEKAPLGGETYVSKVKFVPQTRFNTTDVVVVTVHKEVESYCGVKMEKDHVETVKIESEVTSILADSTITVSYHGEKELRIQVLPKDAAAGKLLHAVSSSPIIAAVNAADVTIDQDGGATLTISGELPGGAVLNFTVDGTDVTTMSKIRVVLDNGNTVSTPVASVHSGETISDTDLLALSCTTEGATIYYTLDGSCPCDEQNRIKYVGPITLPIGQVTLQAIAVREGMEDSDVAVYEYTVKSAVGIDAAKENHHVDAYYENGCIVISGAKGASCRVFDLQGYELASLNRLGDPSRIKLPKTDVYVVNILFGDGQTLTCKVLAK